MNPLESSSFPATESWWRGIIVALDRNGAITHINENGCRILGCSFAHVEGKLWIDTFIPKSERDRVHTLFNDIMDGKLAPVNAVEGEVITCTGTVRSIRWYNTRLKDADGRITGTMSYGEDITGEKQAQDSLRKMQQFQESVIANANIWIAVLSPDSTILVWNDAATAISGYQKNEVIGKKTVWKQLYPDEDYRRKVTGEIKRIIGRDKYLENFETEIRCADGTIKTIVWNTRGLRDNDGAITGYIAIGRDITERKQAEEALRVSEEKFRMIFEHSNDAIILMEILSTGVIGRIIDVNDVIVRQTGYTKEELLSGSIGRIDSPDMIRKLPAVLSKLFAKGNATFESEVVRKDGTLLPVEMSLRLVKLKETSYMVSVARDITERKRAETAIRESEQMYRSYIENAIEGVFVVDTAGRYLDVNPAACEMVGYTREEMQQRTIADLAPQESLTTALAEFEALKNAGWISIEMNLKKKDGSLVPVILSAVTLPGGRIMSFCVDITNRKQMETALRESRQLFADIISFLPDPTFVIDMDGKVLAWNRALEQYSGIPAGDMIGKGDHEYSLWHYGIRRPVLIDLVLHPDQDAGRLDYTDIHVDGHTVTAQAEIIRTGSGHLTTLLLVASPLMDAQGKITGAIESIRDISPLKETEAELSRINQNLENIVSDRTMALEEEIAQRVQAENDVKDALKYTRSVIEANPDLVTVLDGKGTVMDVNATTESLTGVPREKMIGTAYFTYLVDDGTLHDVFSRLFETGKMENTIQVHRTDGHITPLAINATLIRGNDPADTRIIIAGHDITRQKHDEESIKASLDEKILLLREVHHRVKNNLQIIISLVSLQMRQTDNPEVKQFMSETQNRVRAMSLVHEKLYQSDSLSHIDFADYTRFLASRLFSFYGTDTRKVRLDFAMEKILMDINTAIPLGLLMNELISNALRHAFPNGREGAISISGRNEGNLITLIVRDNGIGIPKELDWKSTTSLGMQLATSLVDQVDGTITLDRKNGTMFTITVKMASPQEEPDDMHIQASRGLSELPIGGSAK